MDLGRRDQEDVTREVTRVITSCVERAERAWPEISVPRERFIAHVMSKLEGDPAQAIEKLHTDDLYLAIACAEGSRGALEAFERWYLPAVDRAVARIEGGADRVAEVRQIVRELVLVPQKDGPPRIADFSGKSRLTAWLRAIAVREALRLAKRNGREALDEEEQIAAALGDDVGPELAYFRKVYLGEFRAALRDAIEGLSDRQKVLLRQNALDGVSIDRLASLYGVHRATVARWLNGARAALLRGTRKALLGRLKVTPAELESILRLIGSQLDVSLRRLLP